MSLLSGLGSFSLAAAQGYQKKQAELKTEAERLADKQRDQSRQDSADLRSIESHNLQQQSTQYSLDQQKVTDAQKLEETNRTKLIRDGVSEAMLAHQSGDLPSAFSAYASTGNKLHPDRQMVFDTDPNTGAVMVDANGQAMGMVVDGAGKPIGKKSPMTLDRLNGAVLAMADPLKFAESQQKIADEAAAEQRKLKLPMAESDRQKLRLQQQLDDEAAARDQGYKVTNAATEQGYKVANAAIEQEYKTSNTVLDASLKLPTGKNKTPAMSALDPSLAVGLQNTQALFEANPSLMPQGLSPEIANLVKANIVVESAGNPNAVSPVGAKGLMQIMPIARQDTMQRGAPDAYVSPQANVAAGTMQLQRLLKQYGGDQMKAVAANNWGEGNLNKLLKAHPNDWQQHLPPETKAHLVKIAQAYGAVSGGGSSVEANLAKNNKAASLINAQLPAVAKQMTSDVGDGSGAIVSAKLARAAGSLALMQGETRPEVRRQHYQQAAQYIVDALPTDMDSDDQAAYANNTIVKLLGESSLQGMSGRLRLSPRSNATKPPAKDAASPTTTANPLFPASQPVVRPVIGAKPSMTLGLPVNKDNVDSAALAQFGI
jgi:hypothetical protein